MNSIESTAPGFLSVKSGGLAVELLRFRMNESRLGTAISPD